MFLARAVRLCPAALRADMMRCYGVSLSDLGRGADAFDMADLAAHLPLGSDTIAALNPAGAYTHADYLLHAIACLLSHAYIPFPWESEGNGIGDLAAMPRGELRKYLFESEWKEDGEDGEII